MFARYASGLWGYLDSTLTLEESRASIVELLALREENFLGCVRRSIFENPASPYLALFRHAGIQLGDIEALVRQDGLDRALGKLLDSGVYVGLDEFKGRQPIRRRGLEIPVQVSSFDNPIIRKHLEGRTGGSRGAPRRLAIDLDKYAVDSAADLIFMHDAGALDRPVGVWRSGLPNNSGINKWFRQVKIGRNVEEWFSAQPMSYRPAELKYALFTHFTHLAAATQREGFPMPAACASRRGRGRRTLAGGEEGGGDTRLSRHRGVRPRCAFVKPLSNTVWILPAPVFRVGSEPLTEAKTSVDAGSRCSCAGPLSMTECGRIGMGCTRPDPSTRCTSWPTGWRWSSGRCECAEAIP